MACCPAPSSCPVRVRPRGGDRPASVLSGAPAAYPAAMTRPPGHPALTPFGTTIFATMSALAAQHDAINLGQGFPDTDGPPEVLEAAVAAIRGGRNQYPPGAGVPELLDAVAAHQERFYGLRVDPRREVLVTVGATEAIAATVLALVQPGDEVVTFEPYYDSYAATIALAGGVRRTSVLRFPDFAVDEASLRAAFSDRDRGSCCSTRRTTPRARSSRATSSSSCAPWPASTTPGSSPTRSTSTSPSTAPDTCPWPPCPGWRSGRSRSRRPARPSRRPDGRSAGSAARPTPSRRCGRSSSSSRTSGPARSSPRWRRAWPCPTTSTRASRRSLQAQARPARRRAAGGRHGGLGAPRHLLRHR